MRHIIKSLTICILLISCIDEKVAPNSEWTYSGYLYEDCSEEKVFAGLELNFYDHSLGGIGLKEKNDFKGTVYTDSNGYYTITAKFRHDDVVVKDQHDRLIFRMRNELSTMGQRVNST